ncbi:MAG: helix-hairpin-helix domain-containing protein [Methanoregulaceae archaeon]|nr:helix-hairpin-helix domain-containing protein [Methanoregulaceae archaeon]
MIAAFPEIGLKNARLLLGHFGSVRGVIDAEAEEMMKVEGIGKKKAEGIRELSRRPYE